MLSQLSTARCAVSKLGLIWRKNYLELYLKPCLHEVMFTIDKRLESKKSIFMAMYLVVNKIKKKLMSFEHITHG